MQQKVCCSLQLLRDGREKIAEHHVSHTSLSYLEAVAKLRCSLSVVAELLHTQQTVECWQYTNDDEFILLIDEVKNFCSHFQLKENEAGPWPAVYLVKLLMRRYGPSFLYSMCKNTDFLWIVPEHLRSIDEVHSACITHTHMCTSFHCTPMYTHIHTCIHTHAEKSKDRQVCDL